MSSSLYTFRSAVIADMRMYRIPVGDASPLRLARHLLFLLAFSPGFACVFWYRVNRAVARHSPHAARLIGAWRFYTFGNDISYRAEIGPGLMIGHPSDIVIGAGVRVGSDCTIYNGVTLGAKYFDRLDEKPSLGDNVFIGTGAKVLGEIHVGDRSHIGALTFCDKSVPPDSVAYGNPLVIRGRV
jgi:serine O-acetyltransferase